MRRARDGSLVVHHDRAIEGVGAIDEMDRGELPAYVPVLEEVLEACEGMDVDIEIKNLPSEPCFDPAERAARQVARLLRAREEVAGRVVVTSFVVPSLLAAKEEYPELATGLLVHPAVDPAGVIDLAKEAGCRVFLPHHSALTGGPVDGRELVERAHDAGMAVAVWTPDDEGEIELAFACGVDAVVTDEPALAASVRSHRLGAG